MINEILNLIESRIVLIPFEKVQEFVSQCNMLGIYPSGGAFDECGQYLYI